jgi:hypothetical protein
LVTLSPQSFANFKEKLYTILLFLCYIWRLVSLFLSVQKIFNKFPNFLVREYPSRVSNHILELIQISVSKMQYIIMYRCSRKSETCLMFFYAGSLLGVLRSHLLSDWVSFWVNSSANTKSLLLQHIFSGGVHYCLNNYTFYKIRFHLLYSWFSTIWNHVIYHQMSCCSPVRRQIVRTQIFPNSIKIYLRVLHFYVVREPLPF